MRDGAMQQMQQGASDSGTGQEIAGAPPPLAEGVAPDLDTVPAIGSCVRCGRALGLAAAKVGGQWYGNAICATGAPCPLDREEPAVPEARLYAVPRRYLRRRLPRELRAASSSRPPRHARPRS